MNIYMSERISKIVPELNKASQEEIEVADRLLAGSVLKDSNFGDTELPDFRIKDFQTTDFQDTIIEENEPHDFLNSDTLKNGEVLGLDLAETPGDLSRAEA